jgi:hypothetical protein
MDGGPSDTAANALQTCMREDFNALHPLVQQAHRGKIHLTGTVAVARGRGLAGLLAALMKLPATDPACPMTVDGEHHADRMVWCRRFRDQPMVSNFRNAGDHLVESLGPLRLTLRPEAIDGRLHYRLLEVRRGALRLPRFLMPQLIAWEGEENGFYLFEVEIRLPLLGRLVRYAGRLTLKAN